MALKNAVLWGVKPRASCETRRFEGTIRLHHQSEEDLLTVVMEAIHFSEMSVITRATSSNIPDDGILHRHRSGNLKSYQHRIVHKPVRLKKLHAFLREIDLLKLTCLNTKRFGFPLLLQEEPVRWVLLCLRRSGVRTAYVPLEDGDSAQSPKRSV
jgi:hypothetical protein